ncbi:MAG TPA: hypothetical protein VET65_09690 [Candidatus Limnocylindrales bacterium]|nr:hypothetical protein [Candidatus Limnocylindrales bacterium]
MLRSLFGGQPPRVLEPPGRVIERAVLDRHKTRHVPAVGERLAGQTTNFTIFSDGSPAGDAAAAALLQSAEADYAAVQAWFSGIALPNLPFNVYTDPQAGGAYHFGCGGTDIHVQNDPQRAPGYLVAEVVEVFQDTLANGWNCGQTNGEALSRVLAFDRYQLLAQDFMPTEQDWWANGHPDFVNDNSSDDRNQIANGCGDLFLYYLHSQLNFSWQDIIKAGGNSLGATYQALAGYDGGQGFADFIAGLTRIAQNGSLALPANGNPYPLSG